MNISTGNTLELSSFFASDFCKDTAIDSCVAFGLTGVTCIFASTPYVAGTLVVFAVSVLAVNVLSRLIAELFKRVKQESSADALRWIAPFNASLLYGTTGNVLAHEAGHKAAVSLVYQNAKSKISIDSLFSASTMWTPSRYSYFGNLLGPLNARMLIAASGALAAVAIAALGIVLALEWTGAREYVREGLFFSSIFSITGHVSYALSALSSNPADLSHDFNFLWKCGIHPIVSAVSIAVIPILAVMAWSSIRKSESTIIKMN